MSAPTEPVAATPAARIHNIGYRHYDGPRLGAGFIGRSLYVDTLRGAFGLGRSAKSKIMPFVLLALQAPVAGDLRAIVSSIQIVADVDRMGALALHVAKIARRRHPQHALPEEVNGYFAEMGRVAVELGHSAQEVLLTRDPEKAARIREEDDAMDDLHRHLFTVLMDREWKYGVADIRCVVRSILAICTWASDCRKAPRWWYITPLGLPVVPLV